MAIKIDLPELSDDQYVEMKAPKFLPWGVQKEITSLVTKESTESQLDVAEKLTVALIKSGNVLNEDGVPFVFPLNETTVKEIPAIIIEKSLPSLQSSKAQLIEKTNKAG